ncbi:MAG: dihydropteroate synthase [Chloroflexi bacterium]|nr:dihydropteroate synthase [Chloroflexota bacterium]
MGIVNMTPDSFSGDGVGADPEAALALGRRLVAEGADILDVGGESSRPPHTYGERAGVTAAEELRRVVPAVRRLAEELRVPISIDTTKPNVARAALDAGAAMLNDVWGVAAHPEMLALAAERRVPIVLMHNQVEPCYGDMMASIVGALERAIGRALAAGVAPWQIIVDPGFGFGKRPAHNLELTARLAELRSLGRPILYGSSRKSTIGAALGGLPPGERVEGTGATVALAIANGADIVRVHDVAHMARVARVADAVVRGPWQRST